MINFWQKLPRPILALAPMVGVTNSVFRRVAKDWGADVVYTEMISADALVHGSRKAWSMVEHDPSEYPLVAQLMGREPDVLARAAKEVASRGVSGIDINFGCPANKIAKNFCGVMLMRDLDRVRRLIEATLSAVDIPVSIKARVSISVEKMKSGPGSGGRITILDMLEKVSDLPLAAIMVHGRSFENSFDGGVDLEMIKAVKEKFKHGPVLANGGLTTIESSREILNATGADGLGLARSVLGRPWLFRQIRQYLGTDQYENFDWPIVKGVMLGHSQLQFDIAGERRFPELRRHLSHYVRGFNGASYLRQQLVRASSPSDVARILAAV